MPKKIYPDRVKLKANPLVKEVWESKIKQSPSKNKHISYSSLSTYNKCPKKWELMYLRNEVPFTQNIYTCFGTAMHETLQEYLEVLYHDKVKTANELNINQILYDNMIKAYFSTKTAKLAGIETLLYQQIRPGVVFKGLVDLVFYHPNTDRWTIMDIKTSTRGWNDTYKKNPNLTAQVILYREFFAKQFNIDKDKIDVEFFIVKRRVPAEAEFATQQRRVQEFSPASGPRKTKQVIESMNKFIAEVLDKDNNYIDQEYSCTSPFGKCSECSDFVK